MVRVFSTIAIAIDIDPEGFKLSANVNSSPEDIISGIQNASLSVGVMSFPVE